MEKYIDIFTSMWGWITSVLVFIWGGWTNLFAIFLILVILDFVIGVLAGFVNKELSSYRGTYGIAKKVMVIFVIAVAHILDLILGTGDIIRNATLSFYCVIETVSILENLSRSGVPIPDKVKDALKIISDKNIKKGDKNE
jgi:toxin secretion/phage lysis holin